MSVSSLGKLMKRYERDLGVSCSYCHVENRDTGKLDYVSDENPRKQTARIMMTMLDDINDRHLAQLGSDHRYATGVTCGELPPGPQHPAGVRRPSTMTRRRRAIVPRLALRAALVLAAALLAIPAAQAQIAVKNQGYVPYSDAPIFYRSEDISDPVTLLQRRLDAGTARLEFDSQSHGYLRSVLKLLDLPVSSQTLVFSKTSFQYPKISPEHPRALYFKRRRLYRAGARGQGARGRRVSTSSRARSSSSSTSSRRRSRASSAPSWIAPSATSRPARAAYRACCCARYTPPVRARSSLVRRTSSPTRTVR